MNKNHPSSNAQSTKGLSRGSYYPDFNSYDYLPWFIKESKSTCYDKDGNLMAFCSRYCTGRRYANCSYNNCGGGICYRDDDYSGQNQYLMTGRVRVKTPRVRLKQSGYYRTSRYLGRIYKGIVEKKDPLLKTTWYQSGGYKNTIQKVNNGVPAGCGTIAVAQIMAYHKKSKFKRPGKYDYWKYIHQTNLTDDNYYKGKDGFYYLKNYENDESPISKLIYEVYDEVITWSTGDFSMSNDERCAYYLQDAGYTVSGWRWWFFGWHYEANDYSYDDVEHEIYRDRPVYLSGWAGINKVHIWVADGYAKFGYVHRYEKSTGYYSYGTKSSTTTDDSEHIDAIDKKMIHMNWGWGYQIGESKKQNQISDRADGGWCTYDYWLTPTLTSGKKKYGGRKKYGWGDMITVKP